MGESYSVGACCAKGVPFLLVPLVSQTQQHVSVCIMSTGRSVLASIFHDTVTNISVAKAPYHQSLALHEHLLKQ